MRRDDSGFTLLEVVIATLVVGIVMTAMVTFFVSTTIVVSRQRDRQTAVQLADDAMESVRAAGPAVSDGRVSGNAGYVAPGVDLTGMSQLDALDPAWNGPVPLPVSASRGTVAGVRYTQYDYVGICYQAESSAGELACAKATNDVRFLRVIVAITWPDRRCTGGTCSYTTSTLVSCGMWTNADPCARAEPVFRVIP
jgi:prepilin-type N-terminal cleavage/methylation domain-containing protein